MSPSGVFANILIQSLTQRVTMLEGPGRPYQAGLNFRKVSFEGLRCCVWRVVFRVEVLWLSIRPEP